MNDTDLQILMQDKNRWPRVVASFRNGHKASRDLILRAHRLFIDGAPCVDPKSRTLVRAER